MYSFNEDPVLSVYRTVWYVFVFMSSIVSIHYSCPCPQEKWTANLLVLSAASQALKSKMDWPGFTRLISLSTLVAPQERTAGEASRALCKCSTVTVSGLCQLEK